jgi:hypothetical protein
MGTHTSDCENSMQRKSFFALVAGSFLTTAVHALDCTEQQDYRANKDAGILVSSFTITATQAMTSEELTPIESKVEGFVHQLKTQKS